MLKKRNPQKGLFLQTLLKVEFCIMPLKVFLKLHLAEEIDTSFLTPDKVHGLFFTLMGEDLAKKFHEEYRNVKPFSLYCKELFKRQTAKVLNFEVNLLEDSLIPKLLSGFILDKQKTFLNINSKQIEVKVDFKVPQRWIKPYNSLAEAGETNPKVGVKFVSPTTFRRENIDFPFPLPELLFKGLVKKWLAFSQIPIEVDLRKYYNLIEVEKYNLGTKKVEFSNGGKLTTFIGEVVYNLSEIEDKEAQRWFNILLNFSLWSGIGRKTTMGLGKIHLKTL